jgi:hypothetical protein
MRGLDPVEGDITDHDLPHPDVDPTVDVSRSVSTISPGRPRPTPVWLQRTSLFVLVLFCVYLGVIVMVLPWWTRIWDHNNLFDTYPAVAAFLHNGAVRGIISGLGLIDIWIGISEAVHYRDYRG